MLPILEYAAVVGISAQYKTQIRSKNFRIKQLVTGLTRSVSLVNLYRECGWVPLNTRRKEQKLAFMYKAVNDLTPDYISDLIPHFVRDTTNYALRNNNNLAVPFTRTEISPKSCIPSSISLWNSLDEEIRSSSSLSSFKSKLKKICVLTLITFHNSFYAGNGIGQLYVIYIQYISNFKNHITYSFVKCGCSIYFFLSVLQI